MLTCPVRRAAARKRPVVIAIDDALTLPQVVSVGEVLMLALAGELHLCRCAERGRPMPCGHVLEIALDPAIDVLRWAEDIAGEPGAATLRLAAEVIDSDPDRFPQHVGSWRPTTATNAEPGSREKKIVLRGRIKRREAVSRPDDKINQARRSPGRRAARVAAELLASIHDD